LRAAKAWALMQGRDHVLPDDVQAVFGGGGRASPWNKAKAAKARRRCQRLLAGVSVLGD